MAEDKTDSRTILAERRRSERRIVVNVPVEVSLVAPGNPPLTEKTYIEDVSDFGCRFSTHGQILQGNTVSVKLVGPNGRVYPDEEPRLYEVMWVARKEHAYTAGARMLKGKKLDGEKLSSETAEQKLDSK